MQVEHAEAAADAITRYLKDNLPNTLRATEQSLGVEAGSLYDPVDIIIANAPMDTRSPLIEVFCERGTPEDQRNKIWIYDCSVAATYVGDANIEASELFIYRYVAALTRCLREDPTLDNRVVSAIVDDLSFTSFRGPTGDITRKIGLLGVSVRIKDK